MSFLNDDKEYEDRYKIFCSSLETLGLPTEKQEKIKSLFSSALSRPALEKTSEVEAVLLPRALSTLRQFPGEFWSVIFIKFGNSLLLDLLTEEDRLPSFLQERGIKIIKSSYEELLARLSSSELEELAREVEKRLNRQPGLRSRTATGQLSTVEGTIRAEELARQLRRQAQTFRATFPPPSDGWGQPPQPLPGGPGFRAF